MASVWKRCLLSGLKRPSQIFTSLTVLVEAIEPQRRQPATPPTNMIPWLACTDCTHPGIAWLESIDCIEWSVTVVVVVEDDL